MAILSGYSAQRLGPLGAGGLCLAVAAVVLFLDIVLFPDGGILREGGPIEASSAAFYGVALIVYARMSGEERSWPAPVLLAAMALRELDADKRFTSEGLLSIKILTHDTALWEKVLGVVVVLTLVCALITLARRSIRPFLGALAARETWSLHVAGALGLLVVSKSLDGLARKLAPWINVPASVDSLAGRTEEVLELGIPILLIMAIIALAADAEERYP